jgi:polyhydroxyalkanoate synthesis regulator phasin
MSPFDYNFVDSALIGHLISFSLLSKLVGKGLLSTREAIDLVDESLHQLEEFQSSFPEHEKAFESARQFLEKAVTGLEAIEKTPPAPSP